MKKSIFTTRFKACCKEKGYTQQDVADKLNISLNGLKHHLRSKNCNFPPTDLVIKMADILDVDVAYLLDEIKCKRCSQQKVFDVTGLTEKSISYISKQSLDYSWEFCRLIEIFAGTPYLEELLKAIDNYIRLSTHNVVSIEYDKEKTYCSSLDAKEMLKGKIITVLDKILDEFNNYDIYEREDISNEMSKKLLKMIDYEKDKYKDDYEPLYKRVDYHLEEISKINSYAFILSYNSKQIVHDKNKKLKKIYFSE